MFKIAKTLLAIGSGLLMFDVYLIKKGKPNPIKGLPLPCPITIGMLATGLVLLVVGSKNEGCCCDCDCDCDCDDDDECIHF